MIPLPLETKEFFQFSDLEELGTFYVGFRIVIPNFEAFFFFDGNLKFKIYQMHP